MRIRRYSLSTISPLESNSSAPTTNSVATEGAISSNELSPDIISSDALSSGAIPSGGISDGGISDSGISDDGVSDSGISNGGISSGLFKDSINSSSFGVISSPSPPPDNIFISFLLSVFLVGFFIIVKLEYSSGIFALAVFLFKSLSYIVSRMF